MPVLLSTGDTGNRIDILQRNGVTEDLSPVRSELPNGLVVNDDTVQLQVSPSPTMLALAQQFAIANVWMDLIG